MRTRLSTLVTTIALPACFAAPAVAQIDFSGRQVAPGFFANDTVLADLNGDGLVDIAGSSDSSAVLVALGIGDGLFGYPESFPVGSIPRSIERGDFDLDGDVDIATADFGSGTVSVLLNDGTARFAPRRTLPIGVRLSSIAAADLDRNGILDLVAADFTGRTVSVLLGTGVGTFVPSAPFAVGGAPRFVHAGDFNGDRLPDVAVATGRSIVILVGNGRGGLATGPVLPTAATAWAVASGDLDGDGALDLAVTDTDARSGTLSLWSGDGVGGFGKSFSRSEAAAHGVTIVDVDRDGRLDVVYCVSDSLVVLRGRGADGIDPLALSFDLFGFDRDLTTGDLDGDTDTDISCGAALVENETHSCRRGNVGAGVGIPVDVLFVNGFAGFGTERLVVVSRNTPLEIRVSAPPSKPVGPSRFALYAWNAAPTEIVPLPNNLGTACMPMPLAAYRFLPRPKVIWNNVTGSEATLGDPTFPSKPAPTTVRSMRRGTRVPTTFFLQGIIRDDWARNGRAAITNGVLVVAQ